VTRNGGGQLVQCPHSLPFDDNIEELEHHVLIDHLLILHQGDGGRLFFASGPANPCKRAVNAPGAR
jgi:hypothetical protein